MRAIAERIKPTVRAADTFGKLSGFRFGIIARGLGAEQASEMLLDRIIECLSLPLELDGHTINLKDIKNVEVFTLDMDTLRSVTEKA